MVIYDCELCIFNSNIKSHYERHLNTNKHIDNMIKYGNEEEKLRGLKKKNTKEHKKNTKNSPKMPKRTQKEHKKNTKEHKKNLIHEENICSGDQIYCEYCDKEFKTRHIMLRHVRKHCKVKNGIDEEDKLYKDLLATQSSHITKLIEKVGTPTTITTNIQNIQNQQNNNKIELNCYGKEDLSMLTDNVKNKMIKGPFSMIPRALKMIYFNNKYPQNKTVKMINRKDNILQVHKKNGWEYVVKDDIINEMIDNTNYEIDTHYDNTTEEFSNFANKTYKKFRELFDTQDDKLWQRIKRDVDLVLWNNM
jgi:hypothetical protein